MPRRPTAIRFATLLTASWLGLSATAQAQTPQEIATAREHFRKAQLLETKKDWSGAANELEAALAVKETPGLRYHLAYCQEQLANYAAALRDYQRAQQLLAEGQKAADVSRLLGPALERVRALVAEVIVVAPDAGDYEVLLDGNPTSLGVSVHIDPGLHTVKAIRGKQTQLHQFVASPKDEHRIVLTPPPASEPTQSQAAPLPTLPDTAPPERSAGTLRVPLLIGEASLTALALGVGVGFTLRAAQAGAEADRALLDVNTRAPDAQCSSSDPGVQSACSQLADFKQREQRARTTATVGFAAAGAGAALFLATWFLWPESTEEATGAPRVLAGSDGHRSFVSLQGSF
ncbi:MAG: hypothetical protein H6718_25980 [Polyangiaceae bacterium]|nr:hypothetical protein [Polyangiaceae bacterium]MCB9605447.1 hypothetical protein [Polyangiaceae bacterium]